MGCINRSGLKALEEVHPALPRLMRTNLGSPMRTYTPPSGLIPLGRSYISSVQQSVPFFG